MKEKTSNICSPALDLMSQEQCAAYLGITVETLRKWQRLFSFPHMHVTNKIVRYRRSEVDLWIAHRADVAERRQVNA